MLVFFIVAILFCFILFEKFFLIPVLGLLSCFYLMAQESHTNCIAFVSGW